MSTVTREIKFGSAPKSRIVSKRPTTAESLRALDHVLDQQLDPFFATNPAGFASPTNTLHVKIPNLLSPGSEVGHKDRFDAMVKVSVKKRK